MQVYVLLAVAMTHFSVFIIEMQKRDLKKHFIKRQQNDQYYTFGRTYLFGDSCCEDANWIDSQFYLMWSIQ